MAVTAWQLFHGLTWEEADRYLSDRTAESFTVVPAVALAELHGLTDPNPQKHLPLLDKYDLTMPVVEEGPGNDY